VSVAELRQNIADLSTLANADLTVLWATVTTADEARAALEDILPGLCDTYGSASATLAADWYDNLREDMNIGGQFSAITAELGDMGGDVLARWGIGPLFGPEPDWAAAQTLIEGGLQRRIANASRDTITGSSYADSRAVGWQRVGTGECAFCRMLIGRGDVYTEHTARFASHDHCHCGAHPAWRNEPLPVKPYTPSGKNITDADRARVRDWLAENDPAAAQKAGKSKPRKAPMNADVDATRTVTQLRSTLADLEKADAKFSTPQGAARIAELRRKIAAR